MLFLPLLQMGMQTQHRDKTISLQISMMRRTRELSLDRLCMLPRPVSIDRHCVVGEPLSILGGPWFQPHNLSLISRIRKPLFFTACVTCKNRRRFVECVTTLTIFSHCCPSLIVVACLCLLSCLSRPPSFPPCLSGHVLYRARPAKKVENHSLLVGLRCL